MTTATPVTPARVPSVPPSRHRVGFGHLMVSEWTKIRSVRSTAWTLILFVVITIGFTALFSWLTVANWNGPHAAARDARVVTDPVGFVLGAGLGLGQLTLCVLGVLVITTEYSTGVIRASLLAVPRRLWMLAAKCVVFAALLLVISEIVVFGSFFIGSAILHSHVPLSLSDHNVTRAVLGAGLYLTVLGLFSLAIGGIIRHTAGAVTTAIGVVFVLPILSGLLPSSWGAHVNGYLPEQAGTLIGQAHPPSGGNVLSAWQGFGVFCLWAAVLLAIAAYMLRRRDA
jgi:ABC-2 type transport system permease protein